jgi:hypothetical protein
VDVVISLGFAITIGLSVCSVAAKVSAVSVVISVISAI